MALRRVAGLARAGAAAHVAVAAEGVGRLGLRRVGHDRQGPRTLETAGAFVVALALARACDSA